MASILLKQDDRTQDIIPNCPLQLFMLMFFDISTISTSSLILLLFSSVVKFHGLPEQGSFSTASWHSPNYLYHLKASNFVNVHRHETIVTFSLNQNKKFNFFVKILCNFFVPQFFSIGNHEKVPICYQITKMS